MVIEKIHREHTDLKRRKESHWIEIIQSLTLHGLNLNLYTMPLHILSLVIRIPIDQHLDQWASGKEQIKDKKPGLYNSLTQIRLPPPASESPGMWAKHHNKQRQNITTIV